MRNLAWLLRVIGFQVTYGCFDGPRCKKRVLKEIGTAWWLIWLQGLRSRQRLAFFDLNDLRDWLVAIKLQR